jgi:hypothetical protein
MNFGPVPDGIIRIVVCDIDNCLVDSLHRTSHYFNGDREKYMAAAKDDRVIPQGQFIYRAFYDRPGIVQLFVTSRGDSPVYRELTLRQLHDFVGPKVTTNQLLMRPPELYGLEKMSDEAYKQWAVTNAGYDLNDVWMAFDDRKPVVDMWRARGVVCYHTAVDAY